MNAPFRWLASAALCAAMAGPAHAAIYSFGNITGNDVANASAGESQLTVEVTDATDGSGAKVAFTFSNVGPAAMSITDVYFDDGTLLGIASITSSAGVSFSEGASPGDLPGGNEISPAFQTTAGFLADSDPPAQPNGVNPGEWLTITFSLIDGKTFEETIAALDGGTELRIGIHVQGFEGEGSESFVNRPVPEATSIVCWLLCAGGLGAVLRNRMKRRNSA